MKYFITVLLLVALAAIGITGYHLFRIEQYDLSNLFVATTYAGLVGTIYLLTVNRKHQRIG
jgi:hypothetical protein